MAQRGDHFSGLTDPGRIRDNNEDTYLVQEVAGTETVLACVIDGVGGYEGGEVAAGIARDCIAELLDASIVDVSKALKEALYQANERIIEEKSTHSGAQKMACVLTIALADIAQNEFHYAHVGDTRLYLLRGASLIKVTKDHSFVGFLEDSSRITEADAMRHPKRNEVNKALGFDPSIRAQAEYIETGSSPFLPGDMLLLCSDGLTDMIGSPEITGILTGQGSMTEKAQLLIDAANKAGGRDNITVVLVRHYRESQAHEPTRPVARTEEDRRPDAAPVQSQHTAHTTSRRGTSPLIWILLVACAGLAAALAWEMTRERAVPVADSRAAMTAPVPAVRPRNALEQQLLDSLNSTTGTLIADSMVFSSPVVVTDTLIFGRDSLHLSGNGIVLRGDSAQRSPGLMLTDAVQYVFLENMIFERFPVAIIATGSVLRLRNVRFRECDVPIAYNVQIRDTSAISGLMSESLFFHPASPAGKKLWP